VSSGGALDVAPIVQLERRGDKKAVAAVAHSILVTASQVLRDGRSYREPGGGYSSIA